MPPMIPPYAENNSTQGSCAADTGRNSHIRSWLGSTEWIKALRGPSLNEIVPLERLSTSPDRPRKVSNTPTANRLSFWQAFGFLGFPMLLFLAFSVLWTGWLIIMTLAPNETANYLMNTSEYDGGQFWLLVEQDNGMKFAKILGLMLAEVGYFHILVKMLLWRTVPAPFAGKPGKLRKASIEKKGVPQPRPKLTPREFWQELTEINGSFRKFWNIVHKLADLMTQAVLLNNFLEKGFPVPLVYGWAVFISMNCLSCVHSILMDKHSALAEILLDSIFDLIATIVYPMMILIYCYHNIVFDHAVFRTYVQVLPPGSFEIIARLFVDPAQVELFRVNFNSLRSHRSDDEMQSAPSLSQTTHKLARSSSKKGTETICRVLYTGRRAGGAVCSLCNRSIAGACSPYAECMVYAYRFPWISESRDVCPCRTLVDIDKAPKTFDEWINPIDVTEKVKTLAISGDLKVLRLMNRQLLELPIELQNCQLEHLSLIYTSTTSFPDWTKHWSSLEFLHVEGKQGSDNLMYLPSDLFSDMPDLVFLHFALHKALANLPALIGTPKLKTLEVAHLFGLSKLPDLDKTLDLRGIVIAYLPLLETLPDLLHLKYLTSLTVFRPSFLCCDGYLGPCDLTHPFCDADPIHGFPAAACLNDDKLRASSAMVKFLQGFGQAVCFKTPDDILEFADIPTKGSVDVCGGVPYRRCEIVDPAHGQTFIGMCYNLRMQVLSCNPDPNYITLRKLQISLNVGTPCNVKEEAWLGCGAK